MKKEFTPLLAMQESARCLLCHDAPCSKACPAETDPAKFIRSLRFRNFKGAIEIMRENNILAGVCAKVCPTNKYCQQACSRCGIDKPIEIAKLQSYLVEYEKNISFKVIEKEEKKQFGNIAIIGSGPSGLSAAATLLKKGYKVKIFEKESQAGGYLRYGIPKDRLDRSILDYEIDIIKNLGLEFEFNKEFLKDFTIQDLKNDGFDCILIAIGLQSAIKTDVKGFENDCVTTGISYLKDYEMGKLEKENKVIVIGGGDVAIDCAITAKKLGSEDVKIVYRRSIEKMPAEKEEISEVISQNIPIFTGLKPYEIKKNENGKNIFLAKGMFDQSKIELEADRIIFAIGQELDESDFLNKFKVSNKVLNINLENIFICGDILGEDLTVVYSIKTGKEVAEKIHKHLCVKGV